MCFPIWFVHLLGANLGGSELIGPFSYSPLWLIVGIIAALAALAIVVWVIRDIWPPRNAKPGRRSSVMATADSRTRALGRIREVERRFADGELDLRAAHLELSWIVRSFVADSSALDPRVLTEAEVEATQRAPELAQMLRRFQQPTFAGDPKAVMESSVSRARSVIHRW